MTENPKYQHEESYEVRNISVKTAIIAVIRYRVE